MNTYPRIAIEDLRGDVLAEVTMIAESDAVGFLDAVAAHLGPMLGLRLEVARSLLTHAIKDGVRCPVPTCFELSARTRSEFARDVAAVIAPHFAAARGVAA